jgi:hypothetical protein
MNETKLPHILTTSANLLGICFFIITGIHLSNAEENIEIMRMVSGVSFLLLASCFLSYLSIRIHPSHKAIKYEKLADYLFLAGITLLSVTVTMLSFEIGVF